MEPLRKFLAQEHAGATVEYVALMPLFLFLTFFIMEISIAVFSVGSAEKAVQAGARLILVSDPVVNTIADCSANPTNLRVLNCPNASTNPPGQPCSAGCQSFSPVVCAGGTVSPCNSANFTILLNRMRSISPLIQASNVTVTYAYAGLGYVGGPTVPRVTVTVSGVAYGTVMTSLMTRIYNLVRRTPNVLTNLPPITVTMTGEDLTTAGAS